MPRNLLIGVLIGLLAGAGGCARPRFTVQSAHGTPAISKPQSVVPVEYGPKDLREVAALYADHIAAVINQQEGHLRFRLASAPAAPKDPAERVFVEGYLDWCAQRGTPGDCLGVQDARVPGLSNDAKRTIALRMALADGLREAAEVVRNINPVKVEALMVIWFAVYLATLVVPDVTVTKALYVLMTANMIAFLGWDGFHNIVDGYLDMRKEADAAREFRQLHDAGERYGRRMGPSIVRIVTALVTWGLSAATGMVRPVSDLPGGAQALANGEALGFRLLAVSGGSVTVSGSGAATMVLAAEAIVPEQGGTGRPDTAKRPTQIQFPSAAKLAERLGISQDEFHRYVKPAIVKDLRPELQKAQIRNPDVGVTETGNIVLRDPRSGAQVVTDVPLDSYGAR